MNFLASSVGSVGFGHATSATCHADIDDGEKWRTLAVERVELLQLLAKRHRGV